MSGNFSCLIAAAVLILMFALVFLNAIYVKGTADRILMLIDSFEEIDSAQIIAEYWNERLPILKLSLSQKELEDITLNINEAIIFADKQNDEEYKRSMARLRRAIEGIKKREELSLENIF